MPAFKAAYLICGDDHGRVAERRARLRRLAEAESGPAGAELLEGDACTPAAVAGALAASTLTLSRRFVIADGVQRWSEKETTAEVAPALAAMAPETTIAFFAREEGRAKAPAALREAVLAAGGQVEEEHTVKPWELPKWVAAQGARLGLEVDAAGARALVALVGERQQRLQRELEKLALDPALGRHIGPAEVELASPSAEQRVWSLADAIVGRDQRAATSIYIALEDQGERLAGLVRVVAQRLRLALDVAERLHAGEAPGAIKRTLRMPPRAAERLLTDLRGTDPHRLRGAIAALADLEVSSRGGSSLTEATAAVTAIDRMAA